MKFSKTTDVLTSKIDDEIIILSIEADAYFGLNDVGSRVWELLDEPATLDELVQRFMAEYDVDAETCRNDVEAFLDDMLSRKLVHLIETV